MIASGRGGDPAAAVEFLATYYAGRFSRARELIRAATVPVLALVFGGIVLFLVVAMYSPLLSLMNALSGSVLKGPQ
jgi:type II secretory pathway component PulF